MDGLVASLKRNWTRFWVKVDRPSNRRIVLVTTVVLALLLTITLELLFRQPWMLWFRNMIRSSSFAGDVFFPAKPPEWKDKLTALLPILAIPIAFWLWHWRDRNVQDQIENSRKDVNLKEFLDVQQRAAGAFESPIGEEAANQLQIAALHQLRGFVRGDYGTGFRRPAIELLLAGHEEALRRIGFNPSSIQDIQDISFEEYRAQFRPVDNVRIDVIAREIESILQSELSLEGRKLDFIRFHFGANLSLAKLPKVSLVAADLSLVNLTQADLRWANLTGATLHTADLSNANLFEATLASADLRSADVSGAHMSRVKVSSTTLIEGLFFDSSTMFNELGVAHDWYKFSEKEKEVERQKWERRGAVRF